MFKTNLLILNLVLFLFTQGCATLHIHQFAVHAGRPIESLSFYETINQIITKEHLNNVSSIDVKGFPYLKTDHFLAGFRNQDLTSAQTNLWIDYMFNLNLDSKQIEISNLSTLDLEKISLSLNKNFTKAELIIELGKHSEAMLENDKRHPDFVKKLRLAVNKPNAYSLTRRIFGLYPLFYFPTKKGTLDVYEEFKHWHQQSFDSYTPLGRMETFGPETARLSARFFKSAITYDILGIPQLSEENKHILAQAFAPVITQDIVGDDDRFGEIFWQNNHVKVNTKKPAVYYYLTNTFVNNQPVLQINYSIWYTSRFGPHAPWIERGALDGLTFRVTLDREGTPLLLDVINNCACYHFFVPNQNKTVKIKESQSVLGPLISRWLPQEYPQKNLHLLLTTGWHQVQRLGVGNINSAVTNYQLLPYGNLESLPHQDGRHESVFNDKGIMKDSYRIEPYIFFPSGISKVGYMRQRGNHPTKLIGRAHFTDSHLLDDLFEFQNNGMSLH